MPFQTFNINKSIVKTITAADSSSIIPIYSIPNSLPPDTLAEGEKIVSINSFFKSLKLYANIKSIATTPLPNFSLEDSDTDKTAKMIDIEWNSPRKQFNCYISNNNGSSWHLVGSISLLNPYGYPFRIHNLLDLFTDTLALELGENASIGVSIENVGYGLLTNTDVCTLHGSYTEEYVIASPSVAQFYNNNIFTPSNTSSGSGGGSTTPPSTDKILTYVSNGDTNGAFYWLGTYEGQTAWTNPYTASQIAITGTPQYGSLAHIVDRSSDTGIAGFGLPFRVIFDLKTKTLKPNRYTWRTRTANPSPTDTDRPTDWTLEGSNDLTTWINLNTVANYQYSNFQANNYYYSAPINTTTYYRYFRFTMISGGDGSAYRMGDFEFYGALK